MANEVTVSASINVVKASAGLSESIAFSGLQFDLTGSACIHNRQTIGTSEEAILMGDVTTPGWAIFRNRDTTNYVEIRQGTGVADLVRLNAGECALFRFAADATAPYALANTASVVLEYLILQT